MNFAIATGLNCQSTAEKTKKRKRRHESGREEKRKEKCVEVEGKMWTELFGNLRKVTPPARVRSILCAEVDAVLEHVPFEDEASDERVDHLLVMIEEDFPFEHN
ncbi:unnamed protein product [Thlaspi arvense]|uniref:Uncharacterized protein n=1 Tax=Thlaspi arvense TaxID=13288 RepID=A0AAU9RW41_THLAR|nr:unnamed protein product [Thlaspi arvense]